MLRVLQVCNVGSIVGGTAACAWTVTRSLSFCRHTVAFLSRFSGETERAFADCQLCQWDQVSASRVRAVDPDVVILHNTAARFVDGPLPAVTIQYQHSIIRPAPADLTICCSAWLANRCSTPGNNVCLQAVPKPARPEYLSETRALRDNLVIGRLCTPHRKKWPPEVVPFYTELAKRFPRIRWEFVGCPSSLQTRLNDACGGQASFLPASWTNRSRLWYWDALLYHNPRLTESFGRTAAEAMRAGCLPIVDDRGGFREQIVDGCGYLCRSPADFVRAIEQLHSIGARLRMSAACEAYADEAFSLSRFARNLLGHLRRAAENHKPFTCG